MYLILVMIKIGKDKFSVDGKLTYSEIPNGNPATLGKLFNFRAVQATFDDENPETREMWSYPDGTEYNPERQTSEFIAHLPEYRKYGVIGFTINFQGGGPAAGKFGSRQRWINTAFKEDGSIKPKYAERIRRVIEAAGKIGMIPIIGFLYFGQDHHLKDEEAVKQAVINGVDFLKQLDNKNLLIEIDNESDIAYGHEILQPHRVHELIRLAHEVGEDMFLVSTSFGGGTIPPDSVIKEADFILMHGNGQSPEKIHEMVKIVRKKTGKPIIFNEDSVNIDNLEAAFEEGASWGYYDQGKSNYHDGFQSPPTNWGINTEFKRSFFNRVAELVGIKRR